MKNRFKGALLFIISVFIFIPFLNAEEISFAVLDIDTPVDGRALINECGSEDESYNCRVVKWYKGEDEETPGEVATGVYDSSSNYIVELAISASDGYELTDETDYAIYGLAQPYYVGVSSDERIVRFSIHPSHVVHFETYGGTHIDDLVVEHMESLSGATGSETINVEKEGYTFFGWYEDSGFEHPFSFHFCIDESMTIYALLVSNDKIITNINVDLTAPIVGQTVESWAEVDPESGAVLEKQEPMPEVGPSDENAKFTVASAYWVEEAYTEEEEPEKYYKSFNGTFEKDTWYYAKISVESDEGYYISPTEFVVNVNGEAPYEYFVVYNGNFTHFIARIKATEQVQCGLSFNMNGGDAIESYDIKCGGYATLPKENEVVAPSGKILVGWLLDEEYYHPGQEVLVNGDYEFTAVWANAYTVTFNLNGKTGTNIEPKVVKEGGLVMPPEEPKAHGFIFECWCKDAECNEVFEFELEEITENTTIYAKWIDDPNVFDIRISSNIKKVYEGPLEEFTVTTTTPHISIDTYGSNTNWSHWAEGYSSWHGFGSNEKVAVADAKTHYSLRLQINLLDEKRFSDDLRIYYNDVDVTNSGYTLLDENFDWGGYLYIDLGTAAKKDPAKPVIVLSQSNNSIHLSWEEQSAVEKVEVYRSENNKKWNKVKTVLTNSYTDIGLTYGKTYYYKVRAYGNGKWTGYSNVVYRKVIPNKVSLSIIAAGSNNIKLGWEKVKVTGYEIQVSTDGKKWSKEKTITKNNTLEYNDKKLKENKRYYYKVRAYKTVSGKKVYGPWSNVVNTKTAPKKASLKVTLKDYNAMNIDMGESKGATKYILQKSIDDKTYTLIEEFPNKGIVDQTEQELGRVYYFRLKVCNSENRCSGWVKANLRQTTKVPRVKLTTSSKKVVVELGRVNGADGYQIYGSTKKNGTYKLLKEFSSEEEVLKYVQKTTKGKTYYYKVRSFKLNTNSKRVNSPWSGIKSIKSK